MNFDQRDKRDADIYGISEMSVGPIGSGVRGRPTRKGLQRRGGHQGGRDENDTEGTRHEKYYR